MISQGKEAPAVNLGVCLADCMKQGDEARRTGRPATDNPYPEGSMQSRMWRAAWADMVDFEFGEG
jgi:hypothetical protein